MNISVDKISIRNFKGITALDVVFGHETSIYGFNETGKTTIFDAFLWCLFGKDSENKSDFNIKALDIASRPAHNLEHSVEMLLSVDGRGMVLKRVFFEKYTRSRGKSTKEFAGHETTYFVDGVPLKEKEYKARIAALIDEGVFRMLTDVRYFNEVLSWQKRREIVMAICGEVDPTEIIASMADQGSAEYLRNVISGHGIEDAKKRLTAYKKKINELLETIPTRIDEATRSLVQVRGDIGLVPEMIRQKEAEKIHLEDQFAGIGHGGDIAQKRVDLQNLTAEILRIKNDFSRDLAILMGPTNSKLNSVQKDIDDHTRAKNRLMLEQDGTNARITVLEKTLADLRTAWTEVDARVWTGDCNCPACGQALPAEQVDAAKERFNHDKAEHMGNINTMGAENKAKLIDLQAQSEKISLDLETIGTELKALVITEARLLAEIEAVRAQQPNVADLEQQRVTIQAEIDNLIEGGLSDTTEIRSKIGAITAEIRAMQADLAGQDVNQKTQGRIKELESEEKAMAQAYEEAEAQLLALEQYIRAKVAITEGRIATHFRLARFRMFEEQINGGIAEICEATKIGVPYGDTNNAGRIQLGMDIIRTLQGHYGIQSPVWIDNAESVIVLPDMDCQVIRLVVSEPDKTLRIETSENKKAA
jgi:DNA repair exonuclease SbcCD ATPase subunit